MELSPNIYTAFGAFIEDESHFALVLSRAEDRELKPLPPFYQKENGFQASLNQLEDVLSAVNSAYIILRREDMLTFVTHIPYRANENERAWFLENRQTCGRELYKNRFAASIICKEMGEVTDVRSWEERDAEQHSECAVTNHTSDHGIRAMSKHIQEISSDARYKMTECRLCDRRMKNKISAEASVALTQLYVPGTAVQMSVQSSNETLELNYIKKDLDVAEVRATIPIDTPSFTFYRHLVTGVLYFIFHSPDSAPVQARMIHTIAIPGLANVHAKGQGVHIDQKIEIHDPEDLVFATKDERIGKFRSMYLTNRFDGTESKYDGLEADKAFYDAVK